MRSVRVLSAVREVLEEIQLGRGEERRSKKGGESKVMRISVREKPPKPPTPSDRRESERRRRGLCVSPKRTLRIDKQEAEKSESGELGERTEIRWVRRSFSFDST